MSQTSWRVTPTEAYRIARDRFLTNKSERSANGHLLIGASYPTLQREILRIHADALLSFRKIASADSVLNKVNQQQTAFAASSKKRTLRHRRSSVDGYSSGSSISGGEEEEDEDYELALGIKGCQRKRMNTLAHTLSEESMPSLSTYASENDELDADLLLLNSMFELPTPSSEW